MPQIVGGCLFEVFGTLQILLSNQNLIQQKIQYRLMIFTYNQEKRFKLLDLLMLYSQHIQ